MTIDKIEKPGPPDPAINRIAGDTYPKGETGIFVIRDGKIIPLEKLIDARHNPNPRP
jgi:hypothetical protein